MVSSKEFEGWGLRLFFRILASPLLRILAYFTGALCWKLPLHPNATNLRRSLP